jgi:protein-disulfide isomerase
VQEKEEEGQEADRRRQDAGGTGALTSAGPPPPGPDDHLSGEGAHAILYVDFACPACAADWAAIRRLPLSLCFRHFPMSSKHPRSPALHAAAEAAAAQGAFWEMADSLFADRGRVDDPHLWERAERFGLDLARFQADRGSEATRLRVRRDFESGVRGGVTGTPFAFVAGERIDSEVPRRLSGVRAESL